MRTSAEMQVAELLRAVSEATGAELLVHDARGHVACCTAGWSRRLGFHPLGCHVQQLQRRVPIAPGEHQVAESWFSVRRVSLGGEPGWGLISLVDVTAGRAMAAELERLKRVNLVLEAVMNSAYDLITVVSTDGVVLKTSGACEKILGLAESDVVGRTVDDLVRRGVLRESVSRGVLERKEKQLAVQVTSTGKRLLVSSNPVTDESGRIVFVINVSRDVTEMERLQNQLAEAEELVARYRKELQALRAAEGNGTQIVSRSRSMERVLQAADQMAPFASTVLILGESGVGKEILARRIHELSPRAKRPFVRINCGAIPEQLLESELFGYEKGAFTGASREGKVGLAQTADGGTLFLDEIGDMPMSLQVKLLHFLQERTITKVGGVKPIPVDVRVIAATNQDLDALVRAGRFREDLFYRLNVVPIHVPPLRERPEDIPPLVHHFLQVMGARYGRTKRAAPDLLDAMSAYPWPGNVRELQNVVERLVLLTEEPELRAHHLAQNIRGHAAPGPARVVVSDLVPIKAAVAEVEQQLLRLALRRCGSTRAMARALRQDQSTIVRKLRRYGLAGPNSHSYS